MDEELQEQKGPYYGQNIFAWEVDEYERHERGPLWFATAAIIGAVLVLYSVITQNFLFAVIIIMAGVIIGLSTLREPRRIPFQITTRGLRLGSQFMPYRDLKSFWIVFEPPLVKNLYIDYNSAITPHLKIELEDQDPLAVRDALLQFMKEELTQEQEPLAELLGRVLKL